MCHYIFPASLSDSDDFIEAFALFYQILGGKLCTMSLECLSKAFVNSKVELFSLELEPIA